MKFKERRGNVFVFDGGYDLDELELAECTNNTGWFNYVRNNSDVWINLDLVLDCEHASYKDIQTAVNLMTILKDEGLV